MSSGENFSNVSEMDSKDERKRNRNCLGHKFDPGSTSSSKSTVANMNLVDNTPLSAGINLSENHQANGYRRMSSSSDDDDYVDALINGSVCNGSTYGKESHRFEKVLNSESDSPMEESTSNCRQNGFVKNGYPQTNSSTRSFMDSKTSNGDCCIVKPKQRTVHKPNSFQKGKKQREKGCNQRFDNSGLQSDLASCQSMQQRCNGTLHNISPQSQIKVLTDVHIEQNGVDTRPANSGYHASFIRHHRPQSLILPRLDNGRDVNLHGNFELDEPDLVDEGAVCDYDKFLLSDEHNSPSENSRSEEGDSEFLSYHFPNTQLDCIGADCQNLSVEHCQYLPNSHARGPFFHNSHGVAKSSTSPSGEVDFDNSDYLKLFDEVDGEHYSGEDEGDREIYEDTGDFIDTDLPAQAAMLSASSSSSSLSDQLTYRHDRVDSKENNLSRNKLSSDLIPRRTHGTGTRGHSRNGDNLCYSGDASRCCAYRLDTESGGHHHGVNSSESENGDECQSDALLNCDTNDHVFYEDGASGLAAAASSRNIQPLTGLHNGAGGGCCGHHSGCIGLRQGRRVLNECLCGITADCVSSPLMFAVDHPTPHGSASCQHSSCSMGVAVDPCVNNLSIESPSNVEPSAGGGYRVCMSNFQNDKSNNHQKVFIKFNVTSHDRKRTIGHIKRDASHLGSPNSPDDPDSSQMDDSERDLAVDMYEYQHEPEYFHEQMMMIAAEMARTRVNAESGVSEPIYEDIEPLQDADESGNMAASGLSLEEQALEVAYRKPPFRVPPRRKERRSSSGGRSGIEKVMIWNEYEAYVLQVKQIATSACGPTAVLNVLKAFDVCVDKDEVCKKIHTNLRDELGSIPMYVFSRAVAGTTAEDLLYGIETLTEGRIRGRFFHFWPARDVMLLRWLGQWMKRGAVPLATLNLQKGVKSGWTIPDAWHHQMVYGVGSKGLYLTNPLENVPEETLLEQLVSDSVLLVRRQDVLNRFRDDTDLGDIIRHPDVRWRTMNVLGQVVNVLRESNMPHPMYRAQLTSHISIPAVYKAGITLFVQGDSELWRELQATPDLPLKDLSPPD